MKKIKKGRKCKKEEKATLSKRCLKVKSRFMLPANTLVTGLVNLFCANIMVRPASNINSYTVRSLSKHNDNLILYKSDNVIHGFSFQNDCCLIVMYHMVDTKQVQIEKERQLQSADDETCL